MSQMSFSGEVKEELGKVNVSARHCRLAELAGLFHACGQYSQLEDGKCSLSFATENETVARKGFTLLRKTFNISNNLEVSGEEAAGFLDAIGEPYRPVSCLLITKSCCKRAFLRGTFLGCGSMSDPKKGYHLEFVCENEEKALQLQDVMREFAIDAKIVVRKKSHVVYLKEAEEIVDLLNVMGAHVALMNLENLRIWKEVRNSVNRRVNCEAANITRTVDAAVRQIEDIEYLRDHCGLEKLPPALREMATLRLEHPDASLKELGEMTDPPVGRSGVNHRLRRLCEMADKNRTAIEEEQYYEREIDPYQIGERTGGQTDCDVGTTGK